MKNAFTEQSFDATQLHKARIRPVIKPLGLSLPFHSWNSVNGFRLRLFCRAAVVCEEILT
jgi:hypothetical protein